MIAIEKLGKYVHLVGIKGAGMAGLAQILQGLGYRVQGSDIADSFFTDDILKNAGIPVYEGFNSNHIPDNIEWAIASSAYLETGDRGQGIRNEEIEELKKRTIPIISYAEALGYFFNKAFGIAITGTHGKSTTAAMIAYILEQAGKDPWALVGAELLNWHSNARVPHQPKPFTLNPKPYFVIEADEYREQFLNYRPAVIAITNIDYDHSDYFPGLDDYQSAFTKFKTQLKPQGFVVEGPLSEKHRRFALQVIGEHNQQNAHLAFKVCKRLGIPQDTIIAGLKAFKGTKRRLEQLGRYREALIIDDYAHHPEEITASLSALRKAYPNQKLIVLFHPHTYSRTQLFLKQFAKALSLADEVYLLDIYASARESKGDVSSQDIIEELQALGKDGVNLKTIPKAIDFFASHTKKNDLIVTMGAGDVFRVGQSLVKQ